MCGEKRKPPRFLYLDQCRWVKDAGRRSERTGQCAELGQDAGQAGSFGHQAGEPDHGAGMGGQAGRG
jgi:hypothetical protein